MQFIFAPFVLVAFSPLSGLFVGYLDKNPIAAALTDSGIDNMDIYGWLPLFEFVPECITNAICLISLAGLTNRDCGPQEIKVVQAEEDE